MSRYALLLVWLLLGLYGAIGGLVRVDTVRMIDNLGSQETGEPRSVRYHGVVFTDAETLQAFLEKDRASQWFPLAFGLPRLAALAMTAASLGLLGGVARVLKFIFDGGGVDECKVLATPLLGLLMGIVLLAVIYVVPAALTLDADVDLHPASVLLVCLLGGIFPARVYNRLETWADKILEFSQ